MNGPDGKRFVWGTIDQVHSIGPYDIVESRWNGGDNKGKKAFFAYVNQKDVCRYAESLDGALVIAIAYRNNDGANGMAAHYFMKMLGVNP